MCNMKFKGIIKVYKMFYFYYILLNIKILEDTWQGVMSCMEKIQLFKNIVFEIWFSASIVFFMLNA